MLSGPAYGREGYVTNCCLWVVSRSTVCPFQVEVFNCWYETLQGWISLWQGGNIWGGVYSIIFGSWMNSSEFCCKMEIGWAIIVVAVQSLSRVWLFATPWPAALQAFPWVWSLGWEDSLDKGKTSHSSILAWRIRWTNSPWGHKESDMTEPLSL